MASEPELGGLFTSSRPNAAAVWSFVLLVLASLASLLVRGPTRWALFAVAVLAVTVAPAAYFRDPWFLPPWEVLALAAAPVAWHAAVGGAPVAGVPDYLAVAALALLVAVEVHRFTPFRMSPRFSVAFVVVATLAAAGAWAVGRWLLDVTLGTTLLLDGRSGDAINDAVMVEFWYAAVAGLLAGVAFDRFVKRRTRRTPDVRMAVPRRYPAPTPTVGARRLGRRFGVTGRTERLLVRSMQFVLVGLLGYGLVTLHLPTVVNGAVALAATFLPRTLTDDHGVPLDPGLALWLTSAVFLHTLGSVALYGAVAHWDDLTHLLSASVVAAAGYIAIRAVDVHDDGVHVPARWMPILVLLFVLAAGVVWELLEFGADRATRAAGVEAVVPQHGIDDTMADLLYDLGGAMVVSLVLRAYLLSVADGITDRRRDA